MQSQVEDEPVSGVFPSRTAPPNERRSHPLKYISAHTATRHQCNIVSPPLSTSLCGTRARALRRIIVLHTQTPRVSPTQQAWHRPTYRQHASETTRASPKSQGEAATRTARILNILAWTATPQISPSLGFRATPIAFHSAARAPAVSYISMYRHSNRHSSTRAQHTAEHPPSAPTMSPTYAPEAAAYLQVTSGGMLASREEGSNQASTSMHGGACRPALRTCARRDTCWHPRSCCGPP